MTSLRVGSVPYLNSWPLTEGLDELIGSHVAHEVPSVLADRLRKEPKDLSRLDVGLVSSIELFSNDGCRMIDGLGVASKGPVYSVRLYHRKPLDHSSTISLDTSSRSSRALTRIALESLMGLRNLSYRDDSPLIHPSDIEADAVLRIGDPTLILGDLDGFDSIDLGELWTSHTELPFVYAVWLIASGSPADFDTSPFHRAYTHNKVRIDEIAQRGSDLLGVPEHTTKRYLKNHIHYEINEPELLGLQLFGDHCANLGLFKVGKGPQLVLDPARTEGFRR